MKDYIEVLDSGDAVCVSFFIENPEIMDIGEQLAEINEDAYMNGYNWEALLNCYIEKFMPELTGTFDTDCEAGLYAAYFEHDSQGKKKAEALAGLITELIEDKEKLFAFLREYGDDIEWD